ncbi:hypothetical protein [Streptomyces sp. NPDC003522]
MHLDTDNADNADNPVSASKLTRPPSSKDRTTMTGTGPDEATTWQNPDESH